MARSRARRRPSSDATPARPASLFARFARAAAIATGHPASFGVAALVIVAWGASGPLFGFSDTWQLVINTGTTIITFLMVFLIQHQQNRDNHAMQIKLDELIRATQGAHLALLDLEELDEKDLHAIQAEYERLATEARRQLAKGTRDTGTPDVPATRRR